MTTIVAPWLAQLAVAVQPPPALHVITPEPAMIPLLTGSRVWGGLAPPVRYLTRSCNHGRALMQLPGGVPRGAGAVIAVLADAAETRAEQTLALLSTAPSAVLWCTPPRPLPGFAPPEPSCPHLALPEAGRPEVSAAATHLAALRSGAVDAYDTLAALCREAGPGVGLSFAEDGGALLHMDPLALVRGFDLAGGASLLARGRVILDRWSDRLLRLPTFGLSEPRYTITFDTGGAVDLPDISVSEETRGIALSVDRTAARVTCAIRRTGPGYCSLVVRGHRAEISGIGLHLPPILPVPEEKPTDPLAVYEDRLSIYDDARGA